MAHDLQSPDLNFSVNERDELIPTTDDGHHSVVPAPQTPIWNPALLDELVRRTKKDGDLTGATYPQFNGQTPNVLLCIQAALDVGNRHRIGDFKTAKDRVAIQNEVVLAAERRGYEGKAGDRSIELALTALSQLPLWNGDVGRYVGYIKGKLEVAARALTGPASPDGAAIKVNVPALAAE